jgi:hypothetical protein
MTSSPDTPSKVFLDQDVCVHIFTVSAAMVGVCLTVIGLIRIIVTIQKIDTLADDLLAINALVFLASCLLSYWGLRTRSSRRMHRLERLADGIFLCGLLLMTGICCLMTFAMAAL